jgi:type I restriction enzyme M protein
MTARPEDIRNAAWAACDTFRGAIDADQYRHYVLVMLFLKYISDQWNAHAEAYRMRYKDMPEAARELRVQRDMARERFKLPEVTLHDKNDHPVDRFLGSFHSLYERRQSDNIGELINITLDAIEKANETKLPGVLRNVDFNSESNLGSTRERNRRIKQLLEDFNKPELDLRNVSEDIIGDAYIFLIEKFATEGGKKAGEFFTPRKVSELVAKLARPEPGDTICDPACGSASLLLRAGEEVPGEKKNFRLFGQESNAQTLGLAKMNMFLHGMDSASLIRCNTLTDPGLLQGDALMRFDIVVANPPFSLNKWGAEEVKDDRWHRFTRGIPPKSRGDYAFILHMLAIAKPGEGRVSVVVPHGVLFRGAAEGRIRESIVCENLLDAVIGLPAQLFPTTGIPVCILVFDRAREAGGLREHEREVLFVDASRDFQPGKRQNQLRDEDIARIVETVRARRAVDRYSHLATPEEIEGNGFNLNIPRYVDTYEPEAEIDMQAVQDQIEALEAKLAETRKQMNRYLKELGIHVRG